MTTKKLRSNLTNTARKSLVKSKKKPIAVKKDLISKSKKSKIKPGSVVVFCPDNFNQSYWNGLSEKDRKKYYGALGYGEKKPKLFVYICEISDSSGYDTGHCVLISMDHHKPLQIEIMRHTSDFRLANEEEF
jgi:hypothetical protein